MNEIRLRHYSILKYECIPLGLGFAFDQNGQRLVKVGKEEEKYLPELVGFDISVKYIVDESNIIIESVEGKCLDPENEQYYIHPTYSPEYINDLILEDERLKDRMISFNDEKKR